MSADEDGSVRAAERHALGLRETTRERMDREEDERRRAQEAADEPERRRRIAEAHARIEATATVMTDGPTVAELYALTYARVGEPTCDTYWGSHGCDRPAGHEDLPHVCGSPYDDDEGLCTVHDGEGVRYVVPGDEAGEIPEPARVAGDRVPDRWVLGRHRYPSPTFGVNG